MRRKPEKIRLGASSCLLGHTVRHDGGHERDAFLVDTLASSWPRRIKDLTAHERLGRAARGRARACTATCSSAARRPCGTTKPLLSERADFV